MQHCYDALLKNPAKNRNQMSLPDTSHKVVVEETSSPFKYNFLPLFIAYILLAVQL
jgi:hypothetical protein